MKRFEESFAGTRVSEVSPVQCALDMEAVQAFLRRYPLPAYAEGIDGAGGRARREIDSERHRMIVPDARVSPDAEIGSDVIIESGAVICAGARIGNHVFIGSDCYVGEEAVIGDGCQLWPLAIIDRQVVLYPGCELTNAWPGCEPRSPSLVVVRSNLGHGTAVRGRVYVAPSCHIGYEAAIGVPAETTILHGGATLGNTCIVSGSIRGTVRVPHGMRLRAGFPGSKPSGFGWFRQSLPPGAFVGVGASIN